MVSRLFSHIIVSSLAGNSLNRRDLLVTPSILLSSNHVLLSQDSKQQNLQQDDEWKVTLPLERFFGGTNCIRVSLNGQPQQSANNRIMRPKRIYKLIVDTGSPYLTIPFDKGNGKDDKNGYYYSTIYEEVEPFIDESVNTKDYDLVGFKSLLRLLQNTLSPFTTSDLDLEQIPFVLQPSVYEPTEDVYGTKLGVIEWKCSPITFRSNRMNTAGMDSAILGVLDETLTSESGGPLFGLVKRSNPNSEKVQLRPTILDQIRIQSLKNGSTETREVTSFQIDSPNKLLTILAEENQSLIPVNAHNAIELVDLRPLGDFVDHYAFIVNSLSLNNNEYVFTPSSLINQKNAKPRSIVAVFDTGLTGCLLTQSLWDALITHGVKDPSTIRGLEITNSKSNNSIRADQSNPLFYVSSIELDWFDDPETAPFVVVLGQTFLTQGTLTVDLCRNLATFDVP